MSSVPDRFPGTIRSISQIVDRYEAVILDQWGVIHDGHAMLPGVLKFFQRLGDMKMPVFVVTNSGRPASFNEARLEARFGIGRYCYQQLFSSFDVLCEELLAQARFPVFPIASDGEESFLSDAGIPISAKVQLAGSIAILSVDPRASVDGFRREAVAAVELGLPVFCTGRDENRLISGSIASGIGRLVELFEGMHATVHNAGKPELPLYHRCLQAIPHTLPDRVIAIGDQFSTDVRGANAAGIESALVLTGTVRSLSSPSLKALPQSDIPGWIAGVLDY